MKEHYHAIVVGGGPAGSVAAYLLAQAGMQVLVIEPAEKFHRKVCGEYLCPPGVLLMKELGLYELIEAHQFPSSQNIKIVAPNGDSIAAPLPVSLLGKQEGFCLNREIFDEVLLAKTGQMGATLLRGERVQQITRTPDGWQVKTLSGRLFTANMVIGADGRNSLVARRTGLTRPNPVKRFALRCFLPTRNKNRRMIEMHLMPDGSYIGIDVVEDYRVNFSVVCDAEIIRRHGSPEGVVRYYYEQSPALQQTCYLPDSLENLEAVSPVSHRVHSCIADNLALIGDAGGFIEPLTGEGMYIAIWTAHCLATELISAYRNNRWQERNVYLKRFKRRKQQAFFVKSCLSYSFLELIRHQRICNTLCMFLKTDAKRIDGFIGLVGNIYSPMQSFRRILLAH